MNIQDRVNLYKKLYTASEAPTAVKKYLDKIITINGELDVLEALRELNTDLSDLYQVSIPVITVWVTMYRLQERSILLSLILGVSYISSDTTYRT